MAPIVAVPEPQKVQLEDADTLVSDLICDGLDEAMRADAMPVTDGDYSAVTRDLLRSAGTIAAQLQHSAAWRALSTPRSADEIIGLFQTAFPGTPRQQIARDIEKLLAYLEDRRLVVKATKE